MNKRGQAATRASQEERRARAERRLLEAAAELIGEVGPSQLTLASIGERAGYSRGLATHHYGSKGALMQRLVDSVTESFRDAVTEASRSDSPIDQILGLVRAYFAVVSDLPPLNRARLVLWADAVARPSRDVRPAMVAADRLFRSEIAQAIERGKAAGTLPPRVDAPGLATVIIAMLRGVALQSLLHDDIDLHASRHEIEQLLTHRLSNPAKDTPPPPVTTPEDPHDRRRKAPRPRKGRPGSLP